MLTEKKTVEKESDETMYNLNRMNNKIWKEMKKE